jgi:hypothetical protein
VEQVVRRLPEVVKQALTATGRPAIFLQAALFVTGDPYQVDRPAGKRLDCPWSQALLTLAAERAESRAKEHAALLPAA